MAKKIVISILMALTILPASSAQALTMLSDPTSTVLENISNADSVELIIDMDTRLMRDGWQSPQVSHVDIQATLHSDGNSGADFYAWSSHDDEFNDTRVSFVIVDGQVYLQEDDQQWYVLDQLDLSQLPTDVSGNSTDSVQAMEDMFQTLTDAGIITYQLDGVDYVNDTFAVRYTYEVDMEALASYLVEQGTISEQEKEDMLDNIGDVLTIGGSLWIDTATQEPVKFTLSIRNTTSDTDYFSFDLSVVFQDLNNAASVEAPESAISIDEQQTTQTESFLDAAFADAMDSSGDTSLIDTDGDGLTNAEELTWKSDPFDADSDHDGYDDYTEVVNGFDPNGPGILDSDGDGLTDYAEMTIHWTDPNNTDSDGDGYADGVEIAHGYDPNGPGRW